MTAVKSAWPVLAEQAKKKVADLEAQLRDSKVKEEQLNQQWLRVTNMIGEYRDKQRALERGTNLADSVNCRQFLSQLVEVSVQAERSYMRAVSMRYAMAGQLQKARLELEKMKKLVEREQKAARQMADKQAQQSLDELATIRHGWRHA